MAIGEYIYEIGTYNTLLPFLFFAFRKLLFCYSPVTIHRGYYMAARRYEISLRVLKNIFQHEKRNFVSPTGHVMFYLIYKHK